MRAILCLCLLLVVSSSAWSARPMITDDARIVDPKACQVETWFRAERESADAFWAVPACNPTGNLEISVGGALARGSDGSRLSDSLFQFKSLVRPLTTNGFGWGVALGQARNPRADPYETTLGNVYGYLPASFSFADDALVVHVNVGAQRDRELRRTRFTWGLGMELQLLDTLQLIAETFGQGEARPFAHAGLRWWLVPGRVQVDATYGDRFALESRERWITVGLRLISPPFLP